MRSAALVIATASGVAGALHVQPSVHVAARARMPTMQFGFQNYDRSIEAQKRGANPLNYANPFATGSVVRASERSQGHALRDYT